MEKRRKCDSDTAQTQNYVDKLIPAAKERYAEKTVAIDVIDPYEIPKNSWLASPDNLPDVTYISLVNYFVYGKNNDTPSSLSSQRGRTIGSDGFRATAVRAMEMEDGERLLFLQEVSVSPVSTGARRNNLEQIVPATPLRKPRTRRVTPLMTPSLSSSSPGDVRMVTGCDASKEHNQSRAEKQKQRSHLLLSSGSLCDKALESEKTETELLRLEESNEDIFQ